MQSFVYDLYRDVIYSTNTGEFAFRGLFESLYKKTHIHATVIDAWVDYLNHLEKERDVSNSPLRVFFKPEVVSLYSYMILLDYLFIIFWLITCDFLLCRLHTLMRQI